LTQRPKTRANAHGPGSAFLAEAEQTKLNIESVSDEALQALQALQRLYAKPRNVVESVKAALRQLHPWKGANRQSVYASGAKEKRPHGNRS